MPHITRKMNILGLAVSLFAAACTTINIEEPGRELRAIAFTPRAESRATINKVEDMSAFNVWGWHSDGATTTNIFDATLVSRDAGWNYTDGVRYWQTGKTYDFYALHPSAFPDGMTAAVSENGTITVTGFDCSATGADAIDLMTASKTGIIYQANETPQPVALKFSHELAKIDVIIQAMLSVKVRIIDVKIYGISTSGNFTLNTTNNTRIWDELQTAVSSTDTPYSNTTETELDGDGTTNQIAAFSELLLIPQSIRTAMLSITYQRDGETTPTTKEIALNRQTSAWNAGNTYRYTLLIETDNITFSGFSVEQWDIRYSGGDINIGA